MNERDENGIEEPEVPHEMDDQSLEEIELEEPPSNDMSSPEIDKLLNELHVERLSKDTIGDTENAQSQDGDEDEINRNDWCHDDEDFLDNLDIFVDSENDVGDEDLLPHPETWMKEQSDDESVEVQLDPKKKDPSTTKTLTEESLTRPTPGKADIAEDKIRMQEEVEVAQS